MSFHLCHIKLSIHILLPFVWLFSVLCGNIVNLIPTILALSLHECGHLIFSRLLKIQVLEIEITPNGGLIRTENLEGASPLSSFLLAAAGPLFSMLGCIISVILYENNLTGFQFAQKFAQCNLLLFLINLFPALPLDGGRMLLAIFSHFFPRKQAARILIRLGYILGALLCLISLYLAWHGELIIAPAFAGFYIIYAASKEGKNSIARYVTSLIARRSKLDKYETLPIEHIAASASMPIFELLGRMRPGKYHVIYIIGTDGMKHIGTLKETEICDHLLNTQKNVTLSECLQNNKAFG